MNETNTKPKIRAHVPVTVTLLIPVEIEADLELTGEEKELDGCTVVDVLKQDDSDALIADVLSKAMECEQVTEALECLISGAQYFKKDNPEIKALYTPYLGVIEEKAF